MIPTSYPDAKEMARLTARMLLEIKAVHFNTAEPFTLASGLPSPTYIDCRKLNQLSAHSLNPDGFPNCHHHAQRRVLKPSTTLQVVKPQGFHSQLSLRNVWHFQ